MKAIEITNIQKLKLLEMCKILFPEYKGGLTLNVSKDLAQNHCFIIGFLDKYADYIPNCDLYIHWFEFCSTKLLFKICQLIHFSNIKNIWTHTNNLFYQYQINLEDYLCKHKGKHPIDLLYEQFEKWKNSK